MADEGETVHSDAPAGGWGSLKGISQTFAHELSTPAALDTLRRQNKVKGFMCVSCAWGKPAKPHPFEFCENGAKATLWELTTRRCTPEFFAGHSVTELREWSDHDLEQQGRLTHPLRYDRASDRYVPCDWQEAFEAIGRELKAVKRGVRIVTFNPIREKGLIEFVNPQSPTEMLTGKATRISCQYHQVKAGGDIAAILGMIKHVLAVEVRSSRSDMSSSFLSGERSITLRNRVAPA